MEDRKDTKMYTVEIYNFCQRDVDDTLTAIFDLTRADGLKLKKFWDIPEERDRPEPKEIPEKCMECPKLADMREYSCTKSKITTLLAFE